MLLYCERVYISEIARLLRKKNRAAKVWCQKRNLHIFSEEQSPYVIKALFDKEYDKQLIKLLMQEFGDNWEEHYQLIQENKYYTVLGKSAAKQLPKPATYIPQSNSAKKFLNKF
ncbi:MAG TPA: hypothetical protein PL028_06865 [Bacteroidales bacterium]|nr:hypothetical protein [Bacteroidales bacterium]